MKIFIMEDLKNKFIALKDLPYAEVIRCYVFILINVVIGYLLQKNVNVYVSTITNQIDGIIFFKNVIISLRYSLLNIRIHEYATFEYYLKVFLGQNVAPNFEWDYEMMQKLGELYPCQSPTLPAAIFFRTDALSIYEAFLAGFNIFTQEYLSTWQQRELKLLSWLDVMTIDLSTQPLEWQKLYEASVRSINEQPLAPYYLTFNFSGGNVYFKVNKHQYFKTLAIYLRSYFSSKKVDFYNSILNLEIIPPGIIEETQHENFHKVFPQVFIPFFLEQWNLATDFEPDLSWDIRRVYVSKLWIKYHDYLTQQPSFFQDFPHLKKYRKCHVNLS